MVDDTFSCIKVVTKNVKITLSNVDYSNEITGISNVLESWKRQYIKALKGIVVSYKNVFVISRAAHFKLDCPVIHCIVRGTFDLFIPTVGRIIKGKVNRISHDYIGCLIHNTINAAIYRSRDDSCDVSHFIALEQAILFEITHLGFKRKIIRVKGKITQECINLMHELNLLNVEPDAVPTSTTNNSNGSTTGEENEKSSDTDMETGNQSPSLLGNTTDLFAGNSSDMSSNSPKKKKKKSNILQTESKNSLFESLENGKKLPSLLSCNNVNLFVENSTDSSSCAKKKKSNKSQIDQSTNRLMESLENADESISSLSYNAENSTDVRCDSPKKKKKKSIKQSINGLLECVKNEGESVSLSYNNAENSTDVSCDSLKKKKKKLDKLHIEQNTNRQLEDYNLMNEVLKKNKDKPSTKRAKKRKHESSDRDGLPKKKRKVEKNESISVKTSKKHKADKTDKKSKERRKKDSKREKKKKPKLKVVSSKKKLPKLKKENKEKREKLKKKNSKKSSKHKKKDVP